MRSKLWWVRLPGQLANTIRFAEMASEKDARNYMRAWLKVRRLPNGTEFWV